MRLYKAFNAQCVHTLIEVYAGQDDKEFWQFWTLDILSNYEPRSCHKINSLGFNEGNLRQPSGDYNKLIPHGQLDE